MKLNSDFNSLCHYKNSLECVCLLVTEKELNSVYYSNFLEYIFKKTELNVSSQIDFKIIINKGSHLIKREDINRLGKIFRKIEVMDLQIPKDKDMYRRYYEEKVGTPPELGFKSGPNFMFFKCMQHCRQYNTTLLLEVDCILGDNWLSRIKSYVDHANGFWISGSTYDGLSFSKESLYLSHLNGGTSLYATGDTNFVNFIECFYLYLIQKIEEIPDLAYDWGIRMFIDELMASEEKLLNSKFINRKYLRNNLVFNLSLEQDNIDLDLFNKIYNFAILHKK